MAQTSRKQILLGAALAAASALAAFAATPAFDFTYDDRWTVVHNQWLEAPLGQLLAMVANGTAAAAGVPDATRPSMIVSLWVDRRLSGESPVGYHLHSLLLYVVASAAAAVAAHSLLRQRRASLAAGIFFALAPLHAEVVAAVNYREDLIAAIGTLVPLAWLFRPSATKDTTRAALGIAAVWLWGLLGKESAAALAPLIGVVALVVRADRAWLEARERTLWFLASAALLWLNWRLAIAVGGDDIPRAADSSLTTRLFDSARFMLRALAAAVVPLAPRPEHGALGPASSLWLLGIAGAAVAVAALARRATTRPAAVALAVALVAPVAASPLVGPVNAWADRYVFVGVLGGGMLFGLAVARATRRTSPKIRVPAGIALATAAGIACASTASVWATERALWSHAVERAPRSPRALAALSRVERIDGNLDEADRLIQRALLIEPESVPARVTRVYNLLARGNVRAARDAIQIAERVGGVGHPGLRRARACVDLAPEEAQGCIRRGP